MILHWIARLFYGSKNVMQQGNRLIPLSEVFQKEPEEMKPLAMYRQGDVLLVKVDSPPKSVNEVKMGRVILAYGEVTGHAHVLEREKVVPLMVHPRPDKAAWDSAAERFIQVLEKTSLKHLDLPKNDAPTGEHADIALDPGIYRVVRQREWSDDMERYVSD